MITFVLNNQSILCNSLFFLIKGIKLKWPIKLSIVGVGGAARSNGHDLGGGIHKTNCFRASKPRPY